MALQSEKTQEIISKFGGTDKDSGSTAVQIALLTERLGELNEHFKTHKQDHHSRLGLLKIVGQRKKLLRYLQSKDGDQYKKVISDLGLRK
jgi:small subunit ribosomal protein S15